MKFSEKLKKAMQQLGINQALQKMTFVTFRFDNLHLLFSVQSIMMSTT